MLRYAKERARGRYVKSSIMVGIGETDDEVLETLADLRKAGVDIVTLGQYLRPTPKHAPVERYVEPETFARYEREANALGFAFVASGPLVRSSYHAAEGFVAAQINPTAHRNELCKPTRLPPSSPPRPSSAANPPPRGDPVPARHGSPRCWTARQGRAERAREIGPRALASQLVLPLGSAAMSVPDESLLGKVATQLSRPPSYATSSKASILSIAALPRLEV